MDSVLERTLGSPGHHTVCDDVRKQSWRVSLLGTGSLEQRCIPSWTVVRSTDRILIGQKDKLRDEKKRIGIFPTLI